MAKKHSKKSGLLTKKKTDLGRKLFQLRKQMNPEQLADWRVWFIEQKPDMVEATFTAITRGDYISKEHIRIAMDAYKKGKDILDELVKEIDILLNN